MKHFKLLSKLRYLSSTRKQRLLLIKQLFKFSLEVAIKVSLSNIF